MNAADDDYEDAFEEIIDEPAPQQQEPASKRSAKQRPASNRGRPAQPQTAQIQGAAAAAGGRMDAQLQNELVDKEVEEVIMKSGNPGAGQKKTASAGAYALPDDDDEEHDQDGGQQFHSNVDVDDDEEDQDDEGIDMGGQMDDDEDDEQQ